MRSILFVACTVLATACAHNVPQHRSSGKDARIDGATPIELENNAATDKGIVTYPGGDRVDWKLIELPAGKRGRLDLAMKWRTPRPGLQLSFDVFDEFNTPVTAKPIGTKHSRDLSIDRAKGKYFVRVYAKRRGDAGAYQLAVEFHEELALPPPPDPTQDIPLPPKLADVPPVVCPRFDVNDPTCPSVCHPSAPPNWPGCGKNTGAGGTPPPKCPVFNTQDPTCTSVCDPAAPPDWPGCPKKPPPPPFVARIQKIDVVNNRTVIVIAGGSEQGISLASQATLVDANGRAVPNGTVKLTRVNKTTSIATVDVIVGVVQSNPTVKLTRPVAPTP